MAVLSKTGRSGFLSSAAAVAEADFERFGVRANDTVAGSKADPTNAVRGAPPVGAADSTTTSNIAQPHTSMGIRRIG